MSEVAVSINGNVYRLACEDGQEAHLKMLAKHLEKHVTKLTGEAGRAGDDRVMVIAALTIADELHETQVALKAFEARTKTAEQAEKSANARADAVEEQAVSILESEALRLESLSEKLSGI